MGPRASRSAGRTPRDAASHDNPLLRPQPRPARTRNRTRHSVENIHGEGDRDLVAELAEHIDFSASAGAYLFTGNRGTGKTTELLRLAKLLKDHGCEVFYADMSEYLILTQRIEISDFLISVLGAFSEKIEGRLGKAPGEPGFFERVWSFLNTNVTV